MSKSRNRNKLKGDCYLCGKPLAAPVNSDHVPPKLFFASEIRREHKLTKLLTLPVHRDCNSAWRLDEEYFVHTLLPLARGSVSGEASHRDFLSRYRAGLNIPLAARVKNEFRRKVGGIILPAGKIAKLIDANRTHDVIWKIIRGLHFYHTGEILPPIWSCSITVTPPGEALPDDFVEYMKSGRWVGRGPYQGNFAYCFDKFEEVNNLHYWAFLLWDKVLITAAFHDPHCECEACVRVGPWLPEKLSGTRTVN
jgi:hypothetical protein